MAEQFPAVLILGPRQCGKTTLAREFIKGAYFDLERPSDYEVFADDPELALNRLDGPLILDEAQVLPAIFSVLRSVIDGNRKQNGRFYLLGSVNPSLIRQVSERKDCWSSRGLPLKNWRTTAVNSGFTEPRPVPRSI